jgi:hypothetical protein
VQGILIGSFQQLYSEYKSAGYSRSEKVGDIKGLFLKAIRMK